MLSNRLLVLHPVSHELAQGREASLWRLRRLVGYLAQEWKYAGAYARVDRRIPVYGDSRSEWMVKGGWDRVSSISCLDGDPPFESEAYKDSFLTYCLI
jgi:hypothetical protein